jgi:hypothetical protein
MYDTPIIFKKACSRPVFRSGAHHQPSEPQEFCRETHYADGKR